MDGLILIASYPKSGNTWLRFLLDSVRGGGAAVDINAAPFINAAARGLNDRRLGLETSDLTRDEIAVARAWLGDGPRAPDRDLTVLKVHDALAPTATGRPLFSRRAVRAALYLTRDPRDVAVSFAHHLGETVDAVIDRMADPGHWLSATQERLRPNLPQHLSSWSRHVESWLDGDLPVLPLRYEDMRVDPRATFGQALAFIGTPTDPATLDRAIAATRFEALQAQEIAEGFAERFPSADDRFFRRGEAGGWRDTLTASQAARIVSDHGPVMRRLGYLD